MAIMEIYHLQLLAGSISSVIFISGTMSMLAKAWRTHDIGSYSLTSFLLNNLGNLVYWVYVLSLPFGPVYFMHGFYTVATIMMLIWYFLYRHHPGLSKHITQTVRKITETLEMPVLRIPQTQETSAAQD
jgi:hypothetical protein